MNISTRQILATFLGIALPSATLFAQEASAAAKKEGLANMDSDQVILWMFVGGMLLVIVLALLFLLYSLLQISHALDKKANEPETPVFSLTAAIPLEREHEIMMDHVYDGIRELDNKLPPWWVAMFYLTIAFGVAYWWYYHVRGDGHVQENEYVAELIEAEQQLALMADRVDENSVKLLTAKDKLQSGEAIYQKNCVACHGKLGEGGVGPNLTDAYWLHGGDIQSVFKTIKYGVPSKGMIPWQTQLSPAQIQEVASYIDTFKGTNPPNGKAPQGELMANK